MDPTKKPQPADKSDSKQLKELEAKIAKFEAKTDAKTEAKTGDKTGDKPGADKPYDKEASEAKGGKGVVCDEYHYYLAKKGKSAGLTLASSFLTGCPKYKEATVDEKAEMIVASKACAVCTDWKHERPTCPYKRDKPCWEKDCKANHHSSSTV